MKSVIFLGDSRDRLRDFPASARLRAGFELREVQKGNEPSDWKPMKAIGLGVREIRMRVAFSALRVIYLAVFDDTVLVLRAFHKKTQKTSKSDIALAEQR